MKRAKDGWKDSYNTSYSLVAPVQSCRRQIGGNDVVVFANDSGLPQRVMEELQSEFAQSAEANLRPIMRDVVEIYKRTGTPLSCTILGKA